MIQCGYCGLPIKGGLCTGCDGFGGSRQQLQYDILANFFKRNQVTYGTPPEKVFQHRDSPERERSYPGPISLYMMRSMAGSQDSKAREEEEQRNKVREERRSKAAKERPKRPDWTR